MVLLTWVQFSGWFEVSSMLGSGDVWNPPMEGT